MAFEVPDVYDYIRSAIWQNKVSAHHHVRTIGRGRRKLTLKILRARLGVWTLAGACPVAQAAFPTPEGGWSFSSRSGRRLLYAHDLAVVVLLEMFTLVVIVSIFFFAFAVAVALGDRRTACGDKNSQSASDHAPSRFHSGLDWAGL